MTDTPITANPSFMGVFEPEYTNRDSAFFVVIPAPYEFTVTYGHGTRYGPQALINASYQVELEDEELGVEAYKQGIFTAPPYGPVEEPEAYLKGLSAYIAQYAQKGKFLITLGGEHTITEAPLRVISKFYPKFTILHIDAHADLREEYHGSKYSHACAASRMVEYAQKVVQVGIRCITRDEKRFSKSGRVKTFMAHENRDMKALIPKVLAELSDTVYVTIDVDGLDPSVIPGTGTPVPGGLGWYDTLDLLRAVAQKKNVISADITELAPIPGTWHSEFAAAKLMYKLMCYVVAKRASRAKPKARRSPVR